MSRLFLLALASLFSDRAHAADAAGADPIAAPSLEPVQVERPTSAVLRDRQLLLSSLWTFATLNYLYCDVIGLMDPNLRRGYDAGNINGMELSEGFLLGGVALMQVPMSMVVLSSVLNPKASRVANIAAGLLMTTVQAATLTIGQPTSYYVASSIVEMATTSFITIYAWRALKEPRVQPLAYVERDTLMFGLRMRL